MSSKLHKHLEMTMIAINRMADNSFKLKGWAMTLVVAILALSIAVDEKIAVLMISLMPIVVFWGLDGYYLLQERLFRGIYEEVRKKNDNEVDYKMNPNDYLGGRNTWIRTTLSKTIAPFYSTLIAIVLLIIGYLLNKINP